MEDCTKAAGNEVFKVEWPGETGRFHVARGYSDLNRARVLRWLRGKTEGAFFFLGTRGYVEEPHRVTRARRNCTALTG